MQKIPIINRPKVRELSEKLFLQACTHILTTKPSTDATIGEEAIRNLATDAIKVAAIYFEVQDEIC